MRPDCSLKRIFRRPGDHQPSPCNQSSCIGSRVLNVPSALNDKGDDGPPRDAPDLSTKSKLSHDAGSLTRPARLVTLFPFASTTTNLNSSSLAGFITRKPEVGAGFSSRRK